jgi:hypothetical protein
MAAEVSGWFLVGIFGLIAALAGLLAVRLLGRRN